MSLFLHEINFIFKFIVNYEYRFTEAVCTVAQHNFLSLASQHDGEYVAHMLNLYKCQEARGKRTGSLIG